MPGLQIFKCIKYIYIYSGHQYGGEWPQNLTTGHLTTALSMFIHLSLPVARFRAPFKRLQSARLSKDMFVSVCLFRKFRLGPS